MAETAQDVDEVIIDCVAFFMKARGGGGATLSEENKEALLWKATCKVKREDLESLFPLLARTPLTDLNLQVVPH